MKRSVCLTAVGLVAVGLSCLASSRAFAGIADSPLPVLLAGKKTLHVYSVPSVISGGNLATYFGCTSTDTATMQVGVELFGAAGGAAINDAAGTSLSVDPGATVIFGTSGAAGFSISAGIGGGPGTQSARILSTSRKVACTAFIADRSNDPPTSMVYLTIIKKTTQKGE